MHEFLVSRAERLPQVDNIVLIDANGARVNYSLSWPVPFGDMSDRDYARHFLDAGRSRSVYQRAGGQSGDRHVDAVSVAAGEWAAWRISWAGVGLGAAHGVP